jgi:hypothetical protein|nr:MAG TPA: hypothetical protein [Caudoviricetes sp.]
MNNTFFVISDICLKAAIEHVNLYMKHIGYTSTIEIVDYGKTKSMLNLIAIKWSDNAVTNVFTQFSEYVYDVNFDRNGFESITSKKRRSFIDTDTVSMILTLVNNMIRTKLLDENI